MRILLAILISGVAQSILVIQFEWSFFGAWAFVTLIMVGTLFADSLSSKKSLDAPQDVV